MNRIIYRLKKGDQGVSLVEFALILPVLLVLVIGIIEFGWFLTGYITLTGAAREGARVAVVGGDYQQAISNHAASMPALIVASPQIEKGETGEKTKVTVTGNLSSLIGFFDFLGETYSFTAEATMRQEGFLAAIPDPDPDPESTLVPTPTGSISGNRLKVSNLLNNATVELYRESGTLIGTETTGSSDTTVTFDKVAKDYKDETLSFRQFVSIDGEDVYSDYEYIYIPE